MMHERQINQVQEILNSTCLRRSWNSHLINICSTLLHFIFGMEKEIPNEKKLSENVIHFFYYNYSSIIYFYCFPQQMHAQESKNVAAIVNEILLPQTCRITSGFCTRIQRVLENPVAGTILFKRRKASSVGVYGSLNKKQSLHHQQQDRPGKQAPCPFQLHHLSILHYKPSIFSL